MKNRKSTLLILFFLLCTIVHAEYFKHIGLSDGLHQLSVMSIYQDVLGRMWFGTKEGISIYNGHEIFSYRAYTNQHLEEEKRLLIGNDIYTIQGDKHGNVFFIADFQLLKYEIRKETFQQISKDTRALASYEGDIWFIAKDSLFFYKDDPEGHEFILKTNVKRVNWLTVTEDSYYIGSTDGLYRADRARKEVELIIPDVDIYRIFESSKKEIWVGCRMDGLYRIDTEGNVRQVPHRPFDSSGICSPQIREFAEDNDSNIWFGTFKGLHKYDPRTDEYSLVTVRKNMGGLEHASVFSLYKDYHGTIWIGSYYGGVNYFNPEYDIYSRYSYKENVFTDLYFSYIGDMTEDKEGNLWICTDGDGISCMDRKKYTFTNLRSGDVNALPHNNAKSICYDPSGNSLYIGTYLGGLSRYDIDKKQFYNYYPNRKEENPEPNNIIYQVLLRNNFVYITARNGVFILDIKTGQFELIYDAYTCQHVDVDENGDIWLALGKTLICLEADTKKQKNQVDLDKYGCHFPITKLKTTKSGVYVTTLGTGVFYFDKTSGDITNYTAEEGHLLSNYCYNLLETPQGNIFISSDKGIALFSPLKNRFRTIAVSGGFPAPAIINDCGLFLSATGEIFVGDVEGFTSFKEENLKVSDKEQPFYFSNLSVNNRKIYPEDGTGVLKESLPFVNKLCLKHNQNNLIFNFALSNYIELSRNEGYEYKLDGFDQEWIYTTKTELHYTNLSPGEYLLRVRTKGDNWGGGSNEINRQFTILAPWYTTPWARMAYLLLLSACVYYYVKSRNTKRKLALSLEKERFEKQQIENMNQSKLLFFTNISHEFRTPLTLIITHIDFLLQNMSVPPALYNHIVKINKHARRMRGLVNELLDFRKFDQNHSVLNVAEYDLVEFLKEIYLSFFDYAQQRNLNYNFVCKEEKVRVWCDVEQLEKVFFNLLSNAFKYTPASGRIELNITSAGDKISIQVNDSGAGIDVQEIHRIFDRFYQAGNSQDNFSFTAGTGIGLALSKNIVEKHHGKISVQSEPEKGSSFTVELRKGKEHFTDNESIRFIENDATSHFIAEPLPSTFELMDTVLSTDQVPEKSEPTYTLLIVEDNEDILEVLKQLFNPYYRIVTARNGRQGLEITAKEKPDLIISDIMMPEMTGIDMCIKIKNNIDFCHIPVVLLTALNTVEKNIEGFNRGADDYITKPFNPSVLLVRCNNLIRNRLLIQQQFSHKPISEIDLTVINSLDKDLLRKTIRIIDEHIADPEFDIPKLCSELAMGRTLLYSKFKALTGMTPNNFILNHKMKIAANMLKEYPEMQIAEVADRLGFVSTVYFSRCFKSQFNSSPLLYRNQKDK